mmetsp:Transcript_28072/g.66293  ORF Transcript_28072/g.66293 Transcript_28072/m.66293 type:complete len:295 (+) Transcript_28072:362-1246(+)
MGTRRLRSRRVMRPWRPAHRAVRVRRSVHERTGRARPAARLWWGLGRQRRRSSRRHRDRPGHWGSRRGRSTIAVRRKRGPRRRRACRRRSRVIRRRVQNTRRGRRSVREPKQPVVQDFLELVRDLLEGVDGEPRFQRLEPSGGRCIARAAGRRQTPRLGGTRRQPARVQPAELEVVEDAAFCHVVKVLHRVPRPVANAHHDDAHREVRGFHDGLDGVALKLAQFAVGGVGAARHLAVGENEEDVVGSAAAHDLDGLADERGERCRTRQLHAGHQLTIPLLHPREAVELGPRRHE